MLCQLEYLALHLTKLYRLLSHQRQRKVAVVAQPVDDRGLAPVAHRLGPDGGLGYRMDRRLVPDPFGPDDHGSRWPERSRLVAR